MSLLSRVALKSSCLAHRSRSLPSIFCISPKHFSTELAQPSHDSSVERILQNPTSGLVYGRISYITKYTKKSDIIYLLEGCDLNPSKLKIQYNRGYLPTSMMVEFSSRSAYDSALRAIGRKGRLFTLERADRSEWDVIAPYNGKAIVLQGIPRSALIDDVERFLAGCQYDSSSITMPSRQAIQGAVKSVLVRFPSEALAMHAYLTKNRGFCLNNQILVKVLD